VQYEVGKIISLYNSLINGFMISFSE